MTSNWKRLTGAAALALAFSLSAATMHAAPFANAPQGYWQGGYGPGGPGPRGWDAPPPEYRDVARQGFQDGTVGARRDAENHRRPNVNNRDEYRHPNVRGNLRQDYRNGFRRGYYVAIRHILNGGRY